MTYRHLVISFNTFDKTFVQENGFGGIKEIYAEELETEDNWTFYSLKEFMDWLYEVEFEGDIYMDNLHHFLRPFLWWISEKDLELKKGASFSKNGWFTRFSDNQTYKIRVVEDKTKINFRNAKIITELKIIGEPGLKETVTLVKKHLLIIKEIFGDLNKDSLASYTRDKLRKDYKVEQIRLKSNDENYRFQQNFISCSKLTNFINDDYRGIWKKDIYIYDFNSFFSSILLKTKNIKMYKQKDCDDSCKNYHLFEFRVLNPRQKDNTLFLKIFDFDDEIYSYSGYSTLYVDTIKLLLFKEMFEWDKLIMVKKMCSYRRLTGLDNFIQDTYNKRLEVDKETNKKYKTMLALLYGMFKSRDKYEKVAEWKKFDDDYGIYNGYNFTFKQENNTCKDNITFLAVISKANQIMYTLINRVFKEFGKDKVAYADADAIHTTMRIPFLDELLSDEIGRLKISHYKKVLYLNPKQYILQEEDDSYKLKLSGIKNANLRDWRYDEKEQELHIKTSKYLNCIGGTYQTTLESIIKPYEQTKYFNEFDDTVYKRYKGTADLDF